jgi:hypothetical protein
MASVGGEEDITCRSPTTLRDHDLLAPRGARQQDFHGAALFLAGSHVYGGVHRAIQGKHQKHEAEHGAEDGAHHPLRFREIHVMELQRIGDVRRDAASRQLGPDPLIAYTRQRVGHPRPEHAVLDLIRLVGVDPDVRGAAAGRHLEAGFSLLVFRGASHVRNRNDFQPGSPQRRGDIGRHNSFVDGHSELLRLSVLAAALEHVTRACHRDRHDGDG